MIRCENLSRKYDENTWGLRDVTLEIANGTMAAIIGHSGSGKTTLMNLIGSLDSPTSGSVIVDENNLSAMTQKEAAKYRLDKVGFVFQTFYLEPKYTVFENVEMPLLIAGISDKERKERVFDVLSKVGMRHKAANFGSHLSGGEKQRVCIARALVNNASIILADEPCGNLDSENGSTIMQLLRELSHAGKTVLLVTHNMDDASIADRKITMKDGRVTDYGL
jgi:putative ABC transport system ATP-binding protein